MNFFNRLFEQAREYWHASSPSSRMGMVGTLLVCAALLIGVGYWSSLPSYVVLAENLSPDQMAQVVSELDKRNIDHQFGFNGRTLEVDQSRYAEARTLANAHIDEEHLAEKSSGSFWAEGPEQKRQRMNREQEKTLAKSLEKLKPVKSAIVQLNIARKSAISSMQEQSSASVIFTFHGDFTPDPKFAIDMQEWIADAVSGLEPENVSLVDSKNGKSLVLNDGQQYESFREATERGLESDAEDILEARFGVGNARVQVSAEVEMREISEETKTIDAGNKALRSEVLIESQEKGYEPEVQGVVGAAANLGDGNGNGSRSPLSESKNSVSKIENEFGQKTTREIYRPTKIKRLTVSAVIDPSGKSETDDAAGAGGGGGAAGAEAEPPSIEDVKAMIKNAIGFVEDRDEITVTFADIPENPLLAELTAVPDGNMEFILQIVKNASLALGALFAAVMAFLVLQKMKPMTVTESAPQLSPERTKYLSDLSRVIRQHPEIFNNVLSAWMDDDQDTPSNPRQRAA